MNHERRYRPYELAMLAAVALVLLIALLQLVLLGDDRRFIETPADADAVQTHSVWTPPAPVAGAMERARRVLGERAP